MREPCAEPNRGITTKETFCSHRIETVLIFQTFLPECTPGKTGSRTGEGRRAVLHDEPADLFHHMPYSTCLLRFSASLLQVYTELGSTELPLLPQQLNHSWRHHVPSLAGTQKVFRHLPVYTHGPCSTAGAGKHTGWMLSLYHLIGCPMKQFTVLFACPLLLLRYVCTAFSGVLFPFSITF